MNNEKKFESLVVSPGKWMDEGLTYEEVKEMAAAMGKTVKMKENLAEVIEPMGRRMTFSPLFVTLSSRRTRRLARRSAHKARRAQAKERRGSLTRRQARERRRQANQARVKRFFKMYEGPDFGRGE